MNKKDFVPYELSLELKELGFDEPCLALYSIREHDDIEIGDFYFGPSYATNATEGISILAPTFSQAFRWFREKYVLFHSTIYLDDNSGQGSFIYEILNKKGNQQQSGEYPEVETYEEAELACLQKLIQIVKDEKHTHKTNIGFELWRKEEPTMITDWLNEHGDPEIFRKVERKMELMDAAENAVLSNSDMRATHSMGKFGEEMFKLGAKWQAEKICTELDINHLEFIYARMIDVHNENPNYDYMLKFRKILEQLKNKS